MSGLSLGYHLGGLAFLAVTVGSVCAAGTLIVRTRLSHLGGAARATAAALVCTDLLIAAHLIPGALGILTRGTAATAGLLVLMLAWAWTRRTPATRAHPVGEPGQGAAASDNALSWSLAGAAAAVVAAVVLAEVLRTLGSPPLSSDALDFHLPDVVEWIQSGTFWQVTQHVPDLASGNYPNNGNVVVLAGMLPFRGAALVRPTLVLYLALTALAVYALAVELRAPRPTAVLMAAVVAALPALSFDTVVGTVPDPVMSATFAAGLLFLARHARTGGRADLVLAGLGLGTAFGTKWFGASSVAAVVALWVGARLVAERRAGLVRDALTIGGLIAAAGGFWLVRNAVVSGSPIFPAKVGAFGVTLFDAPSDPIRDMVGFKLADYAGDPSIWRHYFFPAWRHALGLGGVLVAVGVLLAAVRGVRERRIDARPLVAVAGAVLLALVYAFTPYSAFGVDGHPSLTVVNVRYSEPAILLGAAVGAWAMGRAGRWRVPLEMLAAIAAIDGLHRGLGLHWSTIDGSLVAAVALLAGGAALTWRARSGALAQPRRRGLAAAAAVGLALVAAATIAYRERDQFDAYAELEPALAWTHDHAETPHRIGLAGYWGDTRVSPVFPGFGRRYSNTVKYVGHHVRGMLHTQPSRTAFLAAVQRGRYDLIEVGLVRGPFAHLPQGRDFISWARSAGYVVVASSPRLVLLRRPAP